MEVEIEGTMDELFGATAPDMPDLKVTLLNRAESYAPEVREAARMFRDGEPFEHVIAKLDSAPPPHITFEHETPEALTLALETLGRSAPKIESVTWGFDETGITDTTTVIDGVTSIDVPDAIDVEAKRAEEDSDAR